MLADAEEFRETLIDAVSAYDDAFMEKYLEEGEVTVEELKAAIRTGVATGEFFPVMCGSAFKNKGVQLLLDAEPHNT